MAKSFFIDLTKCTACRGCQIACKQWNELPATKTHQWGSYQNPEDLSYQTYKLVRFTEVVDGKGNIQDWIFMPDQCRHCVYPPCKMVADTEDPEAIVVDKATGAVLFTERTMFLTDKETIQEACPYNIPRWNPNNGLMSKCTMCIDRVSNGLLPACVQVCPTGAMNFGDREDMLALAKKRQKQVPGSVLGDPDDVRTIYLFKHKPETYHKFAVASLELLPLKNRRELLAGMFRPLKQG